MTPQIQYTVQYSARLCTGGSEGGLRHSEPPFFLRSSAALAACPAIASHSGSREAANQRLLSLFCVPQPGESDTEEERFGLSTNYAVFFRLRDEEKSRAVELLTCGLQRTLGQGRHLFQDNRKRMCRAGTRSSRGGNQACRSLSLTWIQMPK